MTGGPQLKQQCSVEIAIKLKHKTGKGYKKQYSALFPSVSKFQLHMLLDKK
jgi:hypothetical protein